MEVAYDVEDGGILNEGITLHQVGSEIRVIKANISTLTRGLQTYGIKAISQGENANSTPKNVNSRDELIPTLSKRIS